jgi:hypothetical protein
MKKVSLLVLLAILASTLLMAAIPTNVVRLTIINKSGFDVYMKLTGSAVTDAFYYLTVPSGDRDAPTVKVFTIMSDLYKRETWQCNGVRSAGSLIVDGNLRLTFTPCGETACYTYKDNTFWVGCKGDTELYVETLKRKAGEPRMEKVTYFKYLSYGTPYWSIADLYNGYWNFGCGTWYYRLRTYRLPYGCEWRYQY